MQVVLQIGSSEISINGMMSDFEKIETLQNTALTIYQADVWSALDQELGTDEEKRALETGAYISRTK